MSGKSDHEDQALQCLVNALVAGGHAAAVTIHPDRDRSHPLTVDALLTVTASTGRSSTACSPRTTGYPPP